MVDSKFAFPGAVLAALVAVWWLDAWDFASLASSLVETCKIVGGLCASSSVKMRVFAASVAASFTLAFYKRKKKKLGAKFSTSTERAIKKGIERKSDLLESIRRVNTKQLVAMGADAATKSNDRMAAELLTMLYHFGAEEAASALQNQRILTVAELSLLSNDEIDAVCGNVSSSVKKLVETYLKKEASKLDDSSDTASEDKPGDDDGSHEDASAEQPPSPVRKRKGYRRSVFMPASSQKGYLRKVTLPPEGGKPGSFSWRKRYFVIGERYLLYYKNEKAARDRKNLLAAIDLRESLSIGDSSDDCSVDLKFSDRVVRLRASNAEDASSWALALSSQRSVAINAKTKESPLPPPDDPPPADLDKCEPSGAKVAPKRALSIEHFTQKERDQIKELRGRIKDVAASIHPRFSDDANLARFIRARNSMKNSEKMWRKHIEWTKSYGLDETVAWSKTDPLPKEIRFLKKWWPMGWIGPDHDGIPVQLCRIGNSDIPGIIRQITKDTFVRAAVSQNVETFRMLREISDEKSEVVTSASMIMDLAGLGRRHFWGMKGFLAMMSTCEPNFPERLGKIFLVRAPWIFPALYKVVRPILNEGTANKIQILGKSKEKYMKVLLRHMPESTIPSYLGGTGDDTLCPEGGMVPDDAMERLLEEEKQSKTD